MRQGLLAVDMLAQLQRWQRGERVRVLGRADDNRVEVVGVVIELAEVIELACTRICDCGLVNRRLVHVAQGHDVLRRHLAQVVCAAAARADHRDVEFFVQASAARDGRHSQRAYRRACQGQSELPACRAACRGGWCVVHSVSSRLAESKHSAWVRYETHVSLRMSPSEWLCKSLKR